MDIYTATKSFERWLSEQVKLVGGDLRYKHVAMCADPFSFLRATYYRWAQQFGGLDAAISRAPKVLAVGDLHLENYGMWRDALGRLAWGINDFDEAYPLPYTNDLVRLAASVLLAADLDHLRVGYKSACRAIMDGYREGMSTGGRPFVIGDEHRWFRPILEVRLHDPGLYWDKLRKLPREKADLPKGAARLIVEHLPEKRLSYTLHHRIAGLGNLGKPRFTAIAQWQGGPVAREAKALTISAAGWVKAEMTGPYYATTLGNAVRSADPFLKVHGEWLVRRLAPDCGRIELAALSRTCDEEWLLHAMGFETANVHVGTARAPRAIAKHLAEWRKGQLRKAAMEMKDAVMKDWERWRRTNSGA
jgi:hypothetical protein